MKARAPGKLVLSGAYAVLDGARAIVSAVDRYVVADTAQPARFITPEVRAALPNGPWPEFDASPLREADRKLGLGSSAAILVASLAAVALDEEPELGPATLAERVFQPALVAHRQAQGGGSGIDVAASTYGGVLLAERRGESLSCQNVLWPEELELRVLSEPRPASTQSFVASVRALGREKPETYRVCMQRQADASERAARALLDRNVHDLLQALRDQGEALAALGEAANIPIFTSALASLRPAAQRAGAALLPSGAGGGDLGLWVTQRSATGAAEASQIFERALASSRSLSALNLKVGAAGVARVA